MKFLASIVLILCFTLPLIAQIEIQAGYGFGYILGSPAEGKCLTGNLSYNFNNRVSVRAKINFFISSTRKYGQALDMPGPTIIENTLSNPISILNSEGERQLYDNNWITLKSELDKENYYSYDLSVGYNIVLRRKSKLTGYLGGSVAKYDLVKLVSRSSASIDLGPFGTHDATLYSPAYVSYIDIGYAFALQYKYFVFKTFSLGFELVANRYSYSDDGYFFGAIKCGITME